MSTRFMKLRIAGARFPSRDLRRLVAALLAIALSGAPGCMLFELTKQQERLDQIARVDGVVRTDYETKHPIVVVLAHFVGNDVDNDDDWEIADYYVLDMPGPFVFGVRQGRFRLGAFEDRNENLKYDHKEPVARLAGSRVIEIGWAETDEDSVLFIGENSGVTTKTPFDVAKLAARTAAQQHVVTMRSLIIRGQVSPLSDPRFAPANGRMGLWRPADFLVDIRPGVYFLQEYDDDLVPVLFVHGIGGNPQEFGELISHLDRDRFQPWVFFYPSGVPLENLGRTLAEIISELRLRHGFRKLAVVAHSMGGLVSRSFLIQYAEREGRTEIPLFVSIASPFGGDAAAQAGADRAEDMPLGTSLPASFSDMAPKSQFLRNLFYRSDEDGGSENPRLLAEETRHHIIFGYQRRSGRTGVSSDSRIAISSQLRVEAQAQAVSVFGVDADHTQILREELTSTRVHTLLAEAFD